MKAHPQPGFVQIKSMNAWMIAISLERYAGIEKEYILKTRPDPKSVGKSFAFVKKL